MNYKNILFRTSNAYGTIDQSLKICITKEMLDSIQINHTKQLKENNFYDNWHHASIIYMHYIGIQFIIII